MAAERMLVLLVARLELVVVEVVRLAFRVMRGGSEGGGGADRGRERDRVASTWGACWSVCLWTRCE